MTAKGLAIGWALLCGCQPAAESESLSIALVVPASTSSAQPNLAQARDGTTILSWLEPQGDKLALRYVRYAQGRWREPKTVASGQNWMVNWADFPSVVPLDKDRLAAHWLVQRIPGSYAYDIAISQSSDAGQRWQQAITPHRDGTATEHGFVSLYPEDSQLGVVWLDGRNQALPEPQEDAAALSSNAAMQPMTLRTASVTATGQLRDQAVLDEAVCDCCQSDVALTATGPIIAYRNRSAEEVRDIYVMRQHNGRWQPATAVAADAWTISGCPVNGPAIASHREQIAVAWYTEADDRPRVRLALSADGGVSFGAAVDIDAGACIGRVGVALTAAGVAQVSWLARSPGRALALLVRSVSAAGELGPVRIVHEGLDEQVVGVPQLAAVEEGLLIAWTGAFGSSTVVHSALLQ